MSNLRRVRTAICAVLLGAAAAAGIATQVHHETAHQNRADSTWGVAAVPQDSTWGTAPVGSAPTAGAGTSITAYDSTWG